MTPFIEPPVLKPETLAAIYNIDTFFADENTPYLHLTFGAALFPVSYASNLPDGHPKLKAMLEDIFLAYRRWEITKPWVLEYYLRVYNQDTPLNLSGVCIKIADPDTKLCKAHQNKWSCGGCGKVFLPGSYDSKTCKKHPFPWWYEYMEPLVLQWIEENGGVSKQAPLVHDGKTISRPFLAKKK